MKTYLLLHLTKNGKFVCNCLASIALEHPEQELPRLLNSQAALMQHSEVRSALVRALLGVERELVGASVTVIQVLEESEIPARENLLVKMLLQVLGETDHRSGNMVLSKVRVHSLDELVQRLDLPFQWGLSAAGFTQNSSPECMMASVSNYDARQRQPRIKVNSLSVVG